MRWDATPHSKPRDLLACAVADPAVVAQRQTAHVTINIAKCIQGRRRAAATPFGILSTIIHEQRACVESLSPLREISGECGERKWKNSVNFSYLKNSFEARARNRNSIYFIELYYIELIHDVDTFRSSRIRERDKVHTSAGNVHEL